MWVVRQIDLLQLEYCLCRAAIVFACARTDFMLDSIYIPLLFCAPQFSVFPYASCARLRLPARLLWWKNSYVLWRLVRHLAVAIQWLGASHEAVSTCPMLVVPSLPHT